LKKFTAQFFFPFLEKFASNLPLGLHKGHASYRRSFQPPKENIQHFFLFLWPRVIFALLDADPDPGTSLNPDPIRIHIHNAGKETDP
jgi:hypothetical protein